MHLISQRVHAGFWSAYETVREDILVSVLLMVANDARDVLTTPPLVREDPTGIAQDDIESLIRSSPSYVVDGVDSFEIQFCGHSLGGALAALAALDVSINIEAIVRAAIIVNIPENYSRGSSAVSDFYNVRAKQASMLPRITLYTFGTPRMGNSVFAGLVEQNLGHDNYYRVELDGIIQN